MAQTIVHTTNKRGVQYSFVKDTGPNFGYSGRVAYALGLDKPNYPMPALHLMNYVDPTMKPLKKWAARLLLYHILTFDRH